MCQTLFTGQQANIYDMPDKDPNGGVVRKRDPSESSDSEINGEYIQSRDIPGPKTPPRSPSPAVAQEVITPKPKVLVEVESTGKRGKDPEHEKELAFFRSRR